MLLGRSGRLEKRVRLVSKVESLEQFTLLCAREERIFLELILKLKIALSDVKKSGYSRGFRTDSSKNAVRHEAGPANQFVRCF
ncbi:hypothetical protein Mal48_00630 [Thalassoglobus polymorphus]|uniref:Uncharacterized protein n=1 Tax=Thalassoglobus polymorphus TaxID=2527994 RepID=A0A517QGU9_9PLAN|nr:hypothetical protein Mal48_00630 [Thalassoglobus polymorphus]